MNVACILLSLLEFLSIQEITCSTSYLKLFFLYYFTTIVELTTCATFGYLPSQF